MEQVDANIEEPAVVSVEADETRAPASSPRGKDRGASLVEYALLLALIALVCLSAVAMLGGQVGGSKGHGLSHSQSCLTAAMDGATPTC